MVGAMQFSHTCSPFGNSGKLYNDMVSRFGTYIFSAIQSRKYSIFMVALRFPWWEWVFDAGKVCSSTIAWANNKLNKCTVNQLQMRLRKMRRAHSACKWESKERRQKLRFHWKAHSRLCIIMKSKCTMCSMKKKFAWKALMSECNVIFLRLCGIGRKGQLFFNRNGLFLFRCLILEANQPLHHLIHSYLCRYSRYVVQHDIANKLTSQEKCVW